MSKNKSNVVTLLETSSFLISLLDKLQSDNEIDDSWIEIILDWGEKNNLTDLLGGRSPQYEKDINLFLKNKEYLLGLEELNGTEKELYFIPSEIGNLTNLLSLGLGGNFLETLPSEIGNLFKLEKLFLWNNALTELPEEITGLMSLRQLYIQDNPSLILTENQRRWIKSLEFHGCDIRMDEDLLEREYLSIEDNKESDRKIQMNFASNMFGGILIDIHNFDYLEIRGTTLFLITKHMESVSVYSYEDQAAAEEDKKFYEKVIANPEAAVILVEERGLLKVYGENSDEYRELHRGFWYGFDENE